MSSQPRFVSSAICVRIFVCFVAIGILSGVSLAQSLNELRLKPSEATGGTNLYSRNKDHGVRHAILRLW